jgi:RHS repeat-associated protein
MTIAAIFASWEVSPSPSFHRGEQFDSDLGLYYLRARYYNPATGRFMELDPREYKPRDTNKRPIDPKDLHQYLYADGDPINGVDPSGRGVLRDWAFQVSLVLAYVGQYPNRSIKALAAIACAGYELYGDGEFLFNLVKFAVTREPDPPSAYDAARKVLEQFCADLG